jgi:hypothetical protein
MTFAPIAFALALYAVAVICAGGTLFVRRLPSNGAGTGEDLKIEARRYDGLAFLPICCTLLLVIWTASVYRFSKYGDNWAVWPALLMCPLFLATHIYLIVRRQPRSTYWIYAGVDAVFFVVIWIYALMVISKDSL